MHHVKHPLLLGPFTLGHVLLESAMICVSILAALGAEAWWEHHRNVVKGREALAMIEAELTRNVAQLKDVLPRQKKRLADLEAAQEALKAGGHPRIQTVFEGVGFPRSAWETAIATQALGYMPVETAYALSDVYDTESQLRMLQPTIYAAVTDPRWGDEKQRPFLLGAMRALVAAYVAAEEEIVSKSERVLRGGTGVARPRPDAPRP